MEIFVHFLPFLASLLLWFGPLFGWTAMLQRFAFSLTKQGKVNRRCPETTPVVRSCSFNVPKVKGVPEEV